MYFFTADEHYDHENIIKYTNRPFNSKEEMNAEMIKRNNEVVCSNDTVVHAGDFTLRNRVFASSIIKQLNGNHIFLKGSHDYWLKDKRASSIWEKKIEDKYIVVCHYAMRTWPRAHYGSWQLYGHSHGTLDFLKNQYDIGVDHNNFYPVSFDKIKDLITFEMDKEGRWRTSDY